LSTGKFRKYNAEGALLLPTARRIIPALPGLGFPPGPFFLFPVSGGKGPPLSIEKERFS
jgi:hypothetical protein